MDKKTYDAIQSIKGEIVRRATSMCFKYELSDIIDIQDGGLTIVFLQKFIAREWHINDKGEEEEIFTDKPVMWLEKTDGKEPRLVVPYPQLVFTIDALGKVSGVGL